MNMNSPLRGFLMLCVVILASCDGCHGSGGGANACRTAAPICDPGMVCSSGTCVPCGGEGGACCVNGATTSCNGTLMCLMESSGEFCRNCGDIGEACCNSSGSQVCNAGGVCVSGSCQSVAALTCDPSGTIFSVGIQSMNLCALRVVEVRATSAANALSCAANSGMLASGEQVYEIPNTPITDYEMCVETESEGRRTTTVRAFGDFEASRCTRWTRCGDAGCTSVSMGACI